jgi:hypothetical protein
MTDERRAELEQIKARLEGLLITFAGNAMSLGMINGMLACVNDELS